MELEKKTYIILPPAAPHLICMILIHFWISLYRRAYTIVHQNNKV